MDLKSRPLDVAAGIITKNDKILLLKRRKGDYVGLWSLPSGKVRLNEHVSEAAVREIKEESGLNSKFLKYLGLVSEHLIENKKIIAHFVLHIILLKPLSGGLIASEAGELKWVDLTAIDKLKQSIIPSDYYIIKRMIISNKGDYFNCEIEKNKSRYKLIKFTDK